MLRVAVIQAILRLKSANTTVRYLRSIGLERVREALEDLKPLNAKIYKFESKRKIGNKVPKKKPPEEPPPLQTAITNVFNSLIFLVIPTGFEPVLPA
jgi:hypothetical protein